MVGQSRRVNSPNKFMSEGRKCPVEDFFESNLDPLWHGWQDDLAHPHAPLGGGGLGNFKSATPLCGCLHHSDRTMGHPYSPVKMTAVPVQTSNHRKNAPPPTVPRVEDVKIVSNAFVTISFKKEIVPDGTVSNPEIHGQTKFSFPGYNAPGYHHAGGKITSIDGKLTIIGKVEIQTFYGPNTKADDYSCYGRGTTQKDIMNGDITLGFHEACHQTDYWNYLDPTTFPEPPALSIGMTVTEFKSRIKSFIDAYQEYRNSMGAASHAATDETGHKKSSVATKKCYQHKAP